MSTVVTAWKLEKHPSSCVSSIWVHFLASSILKWAFSALAYGVLPCPDCHNGNNSRISSKFDCDLQRKLLSDVTILENSAQDSRFKVFWSDLYKHKMLVWPAWGFRSLAALVSSICSIRINFSLLQIILICKTVQYVRRNSPQLSWFVFSTANFGFQPWPHQAKPSCTRELLIAPLEGKGIYMVIFGSNRAHPNLALGARLGILLMHLVQVHLGQTIQLEDLSRHFHCTHPFLIM